VGPRGSGRVYHERYKDKRGKWKETKTWSYEYSVGGLQRRVHTGLADKAKAEQLRREKLADLGRGLPPGTGVEQTTWEDMKNLIRDDYTNKRQGVRHLGHLLRKLDKEFANNRAVTITRRRLVARTARRLRSKEDGGDGAAMATVAVEDACLNRMFSLAIKADMLTPSHHPHLEKANPHNRRTGVITPAQMREFLECFDDPNERDAVEVTFITGWRARSDVLTRQRRHVRLMQRAFVLFDGEGKTKEARAFPIHPGGRLEEILTRRLNDAPPGCPWVFYRTDKRYYGRQIKTYVAGWKRAKALLAAKHPDWEVETWVRHRMRHSAVTGYLAIGTIPDVQLCKMIGMSLHTMSGYHHLTDSNMAIAGAAIESNLRGRGLEEARPDHVVLPFAKSKA
jgi:integrase